MDKDIIEQTLMNLETTLTQIEEKHGTVQSGEDYRYVKNLHEQARQSISILRFQVKDLITEAEEVPGERKDFDEDSLHFYGA